MCETVYAQRLFKETRVFLIIKHPFAIVPAHSGIASFGTRCPRVSTEGGNQLLIHTHKWTGVFSQAGNSKALIQQLLGLFVSQAAVCKDQR